MNNNLKRVLFVLFVVSALLLVIGSASADNVELNENLEASLDLDDGLSVDDSPASNPDSKVSNQLTISNIDEETDTTQSVDEDLNDLNSNDVVSNVKESTINAKDSDNNIKAEIYGAGEGITIQNTVLNSSAKVGDIVSFQIIGTNNGNNYYTDIIPITLQYSKEEYQFVGFTPGQNPVAPSDYHHENRFIGPMEIGKDIYNHDQLLFGYITNYLGSNIFYQGNYFNFTVHFRALKPSPDGKTFGNRVFVNENDGFSGLCNGLHIEPNNPNFKLDNKVLDDKVKVGDIVSFEISGQNTGDPYYGMPTINVQYKESELEFIGFEPGKNNDVPWFDFSQSYSCEKGFDGSYDFIQVKYLLKYLSEGNTVTWDNFDTNHRFNFTLKFRVKSDDNLNPGTHAYMTWYSDGFVDATNTTNLYSDPNFDLKIISLDDSLLSVGDEALFKVIARDINGAFYGGNLDFDLYFDSNLLKYEDFELVSQLNGVLSLVNLPQSSQGSSGLLSASNDGSDDGHLLLRYTPNRGPVRDSLFEFVLKYTVKNDGILDNNAELSWKQDGEDKKVMDGAFALAGTQDVIFTKTADDKPVKPGDIVEFEVYLENNGTTGILGDKGILSILDYYPKNGFKYINYTINKNTTPIYMTNDTNWNYVGINMILGDRPFGPGNITNVTLRFEVLSKGILCNWIFLNNTSGKSTTGSVVSGNPSLNLTKTVHDREVELGDDVYFDIFVENNGEVAYYDHENQLHKLLIEDTYPDGLEYVGFKVVECTQEGDIEVDSSTPGVLKIIYTFDDEEWHPDTEKRWQPGEHINITLQFKAVKYGNWTNVANVYWKYKDWGKEKDINISDNDTVLVKGPESTDEPVLVDDNKTDETPDDCGNEDIGEEMAPVNKVATIPKAGNPLLVFLMSLLTLCFVPLKGKK